MSAASTFDGLAERLQRARAEYELRPSQLSWIALLEAENAWLKQQIANRGVALVRAPCRAQRQFQNGG